MGRFATLLLVVAAGAGAPATAAAAITTTTIETPAAGAALHAAAGTALTFAGTSDGAPGDPIDVRCFEPDYALGVQPVASGEVGADGTWTATADGAWMPTGFCDLRAVPASWWHGDDLSGFAPRRVTFASRAVPYDGDPVLTDFSLYDLGDLAAVELAGLGACGVCRSAMVADASIGQMGEPLWTGAAFLPGNEEDAPGPRAGAMVDGARAHAVSALSGSGAAPVPGPWGASWLPGLTPLTWSTTVGADGTRTSVETQDLLRCTADPDAADADACGDLAPTGVRVQRTVTIDAAGTAIEIADRWTSTDGAAHDLDLDWRHHLGPATPRIKRGWDAESFSVTQAPRTVAGPAGTPAATIFAAGQPSPSATFPQGALVLAPAPSGVRFVPGSAVTSISDRFATRQAITVPAGGATTTRQVLLLGSSRPAVQAAAAAAEARIGQPEEPEPEVPQITTPPLVLGKAMVRATLSMGHAGDWAPEETSTEWRWLRCADAAPASCTPIPGSAGLKRLKLSSAELGLRIRLEVVARNADGASAPALSAPTAPVVATAPGTATGR